MNFRRFASTRRWIMTISIIVSLIIVGGGAAGLAFLDFWLGALCSIAAIILLALFSYFGLKPMMKTYKKIVIEEILLTYIPEIEFDKSRFNKEFIQQNPLFPLKKYYNTDYYFVGNYKGINFELGNVQSYDDLKDKRIYVKSFSFSGKLFSLPIETDEKASLLIIEKKDRQTNAQHLQGSEYQYQLKSKIDSFNEMFDIYSTLPNTDLNEFFNFFIDLIRKMKKVCAHKVIFLLKDNRLYFAIDEQRSSFDLKLKTNINTDDINDFRKEYTPFFHLMDFLLNNRK